MFDEGGAYAASFTPWLFSVAMLCVELFVLDGMTLHLFHMTPPSRPLHQERRTWRGSSGANRCY